MLIVGVARKVHLVLSRLVQFVISCSLNNSTFSNMNKYHFLNVWVLLFGSKSPRINIYQRSSRLAKADRVNTFLLLSTANPG